MDDNGNCMVPVVVGTGYNGLPDGCSDDDFPWTKETCNTDSEMIEQLHGRLIHASMGHYQY